MEWKGMVLAYQCPNLCRQTAVLCSQRSRPREHTDWEAADSCFGVLAFWIHHNSIVVVLSHYTYRVCEKFREILMALAMDISYGTRHHRPEGVPKGYQIA
jgi:hypothetical protein